MDRVGTGADCVVVIATPTGATSQESEASTTAGGASETASRASIAPIPSKTSGVGRGMDGALVVWGVVLPVMLGRLV